MQRTEVLIIGAGLAGLSCAYHLERPYIVLEKESEPGGRARSITSGGSTYDFTGHLLHLRREEIRKLVSELMGDGLMEVERHAAIHMAGTFLHYPFQANFHALPPDAVRECLIGFVRAWKEHDPERRHDNLRQWALATFGEGICEHFFAPYNEKLFRTPLKEMSADWVSWSVPQPDLETVVDGALGSVQSGMGYNARFLYPRKGGIEALPRALAACVKPVRYDTAVAAIDPVRKVVRTAGGEEFSYDTLVSTIPLPVLLRSLESEDRRPGEWADRLRWVNVYNINFTLYTPAPWPWQWLYLPEPDFYCYRIGVASNISPALAPGDGCTIYTEYSYRPDEELDTEAVRRGVISDLRKVGLLRNGASIVDETPIDIHYAYVVHDPWRQENLPTVHGWLGERGIVSTGRWGEWVYGGMEDAMWQGRETARKLNHPAG
jgi:protoporphyrinogen oxidase